MNNTIAFPGGFTVLMAVYCGDSVPLFLQAVDSVFQNTLRPDDFVLVVDGPTPPDLTAAIQLAVNRYDITAQYLSKNHGLARALNAGLARVVTNWVVRADADDFNLPERFETQARAIARADVDIVGGAIVEVDGDGKVLGVRRAPLEHKSIVRYARSRNPFNHMTVGFRRDVATECGGYPEIRLKEDYALWATLLSNGAKALNVPDVLVRATAGAQMYRRRGGFRYARDEFRLQRHLVHCGIKGPLAALYHCALRGGVFMLPAFARGQVYRRLLRSAG